jgi:hypothetical protein
MTACRAAASRIGSGETRQRAMRSWPGLGACVAVAFTSCTAQQLHYTYTRHVAPSSVPAADLAPTPAVAPSLDEGTWYLESLTADGRRALVREIGRVPGQPNLVRVIDIDSGKELNRARLAPIPEVFVGASKDAERAANEALDSQDLQQSLRHVALLAREFPLGASGRLAAAAGQRSAFAFNAGDNLYIAYINEKVRRKIAADAAYDPAFSKSGTHLLFRRAAIDPRRPVREHELCVAPIDRGEPVRCLRDTRGLRGKLVAHPEQAVAFGFTARANATGGAEEICVVSISLEPPFPTRTRACVPGDDALVEAVLSPRAKWAAVSTKPSRSAARWRLRVIDLQAKGKVAVDEQDPAGWSLVAVSDRGLLVRSSAEEHSVTDIPTHRTRPIEASTKLDRQGIFRSDSELVYLTNAGSVGVVDLSDAARL